MSVDLGYAFRTSPETNDVIRGWWHEFGARYGTKRLTQDVVILAAARVAQEYPERLAAHIDEIVAQRAPE